MRDLTLLAAVAVILCPAAVTSASAQQVSLPILVTGANADGPAALLRVGIDPAATDGLDAGLENELPPPAPLFGARFTGAGMGEGSSTDYRAGTVGGSVNVLHTLKLNWGTATSVTIAWDLPLFVTGNIRDPFGGIVVDEPMAGVGNVVITNDALTTIEIELDYAAPSDPALVAYASAFVGVTAATAFAFGETGLAIDFAGLGGSGPVSVSRYSSFAPNTNQQNDLLAHLRTIVGDPGLMVEEMSVSNYVWSIEADGAVSFTNASVAFDITDRTNLGITPGREDRISILKSTGPDQYAVVAHEDFTTPDPDPDTFDGSNTLSADVSSFSDFVFVSVAPSLGGNPLPVELIDFAAVADGNDVLLTWVTASELDNAGFDVEHRRPDAVFATSGSATDGLVASGSVTAGFVTAGFVQGAGTSSRQNVYRYRVPSLASGVHAFRLRQGNHDGTSHYSPVVEVAILPPTSVVLSVFPNPVEHEAELRVAVREGQTLRIAMYDATGRRVRLLFDGDVANAATVTIPISASGLAAGLYFIRANGVSAATVEPLVVGRW